MPTWLIIGIGLEVFAIFVAIALCKAAARGDNRVEAEPSPLILLSEERMKRRRRAMARAGHVEHQGHHRVGTGLDPTRRRT